MTVEIEGRPLFSTPYPPLTSAGVWQDCLNKRIDAYVAEHGADNISEACKLRPPELGTAVSWSVGAAEGDAAGPRVRVAKTIPIHGDAQLMFAPRDISLERPRGVIRDGQLLLAATAPAATFELARAAVERTEMHVRQYFAWLYLEIADANRQIPRMLSERRPLLSAPRRSTLRSHPMAVPV